MMACVSYACVEIGRAIGMESMERYQRLRSLWEKDRDNARLARDCTDAALEAGDYAFALERAQQRLAASPADMHAAFQRASALIGLRDYRSAISAIQGVLEQQPQLHAARVNLGLCHYCLGEYAEALAPLESAYADGDRSAGLLRLLVSTYHHSGLIDQALAVCEANADPAALDAAVAGTYGLVYLDADQPEPAARWARKALAENPASVDGLVVEGTIGILNMQTSLARQRFDRALELAPATGRAWIGLGTLSLLENDLASAREQLTRGVELMPGHVGSWHVLAWTHLVSRDLDAAEAALSRALDLDRNFAETHGALAAIAALRGHRAEAERAIEVARRLDEKCLSAQFARSVLMGRGGKPGEAQRLVSRAAKGVASESGSILSRVIERVARH
jgi:tetratricopeptide (TPR) repeat protein